MILGLDGYSFEDKCLQPLDGEVRVHTCPDAGDGGK
jgi:hypothetical protein